MSVLTDRRATWPGTVVSTVRRLSVITLAGAVLGLLVGGVGSRLAMLVLARLNPDATGLRSDDGFVMGQFTLATFQLLLTTTLIGVVGGGIYFVVRGLLIGPRWFQVLSIAVGPAVVVGSMLVHVEGIDFTLDPVLLAITMFVVIPGVYAALLTVLAERWLRSEAGFASANIWLVATPLLLWVPLAPLLGLLAAGMLGFQVLRRSARGAALLRHPVTPWLARGGLAVIFAVALADLLRDTATLLGRL